MAEPTLACSSTIPSMPKSDRGVPAKIDSSPQGEFIVYPSAKVVIILRSSDLSVVHIFREHRFDTTAVRFSPNGELVASGDSNGDVIVWQAVAPYEVKLKKVIGGEIADIAWSPDSTKIGICGNGSAAYIDVKTESSGADLTCHNRRCESIAIHPDAKEKLILMASHDSRISIFDTKKGGYRPKYSSLLSTHIKEVYSVSFNADGSLFASSGGDGRVAVYETADRRKIADRQYDRSITSTVFISMPSLDEGDREDAGKRYEMLVYASTDGTVRAVRCGHTEDDNEQWEEQVEEWEKKDPDNQRLALTASSTTGFVFAVSSNGRIEKLRASDGALIASIYGHKGHIKAFDIVDGVTVTGDNTGRLCIDRGNGAEVFGKDRIAPNYAIRGISILAEDGIAVCLHLANQISFGSLSTGELLSAYELPSEPRSISRGKDTLAVLCHKHIVIIDRTRAVIAEHELINNQVAMSLLHDGTQLAIGDSTGAVSVHSITRPTLTMTASFKLKVGAVTAMEYSPDGTYLAVAGVSRYVHVYRRDGWSTVEEFWRVHNASIKTIGWSPCGTMFATGAIDRTVAVWRLPKDDKQKFDAIVAKSGHIPEALIWRSSSEVVTVGEDGCRISWKLEGVQ